MSVHRKAVLAAAVPVGFLLSGALVWQASYAAFTDTESSNNNSWTAGAVQLSVASPGTAMFAETGLVPGATGAKCITVTYTGTVAANVEMYAVYHPAGATALAPYLNLTVETGTGANPDCSDFASPVSAFGPDTAATLVTSHGTYGTGVGTWAPTVANETKTYRITWALLDNDLAQNQAVALDFTWEAQNT